MQDHFDRLALYQNNDPEIFQQFQYKEIIMKASQKRRRQKANRWIIRKQWEKLLQIKHCRLFSIITGFLLLGLFILYSNIQCLFMDCLPLNSLLIDYTRVFEENKCIANQFTFTTTIPPLVNEEQYHVSFCVERKDQEKIYFVSTIQKVLEKSNLAQKVNQYPTFMDTILYSSMQELKRMNKPDQNVQSVQKVALDNIKDANIISEGNNSVNSSIYRPPSYYKIYRFSILKNGTRSQTENFITFPQNGQKEIQKILIPIIDTFLPQVNKSLYTYQSKKKQQVQAQHRLLLEDMGNTNGFINQNSSIYHYSMNYSGYTILTSSHLQAISTNSQNTHTELNKTYIFDLDGVLKSSIIKSKSQIQCPQIPESNDYKVIKTPDSSINLNSTIKLTYNLSKIVQKQRIESLINKSLQQENKNYTFGQFREYLAKQKITDLNKDGIIENTTNIRLLQEQNNNTKILKAYKQDKLTTGYIFGIKFVVSAYTNIQISVKQDPENSLKKESFVDVDFGTQLVIGQTIKNNSFLKTNKTFQSLSLGYTQREIRLLMQSLQPKFIQLTNKTFDRIVSGISFFQFVNSSKNFSILTNRIVQKVQNQIQKMNGLNIIQNILDLALQAKNKIQNQIVSQILSSKVPVVDSLVSDIKEYYNKNINSALDKFNKFKQSLPFHKGETHEFVDELQDQYYLRYNETYESVQNLIPPEIQQIYNKQMKKAQPILQFFKYVIQGIKNYQDLFLENKNKHIINFQASYRKTHEDYLNVTKGNLTKNFISKLDNISKSFNTQYRRLRVPFEQFQQIIDNKIVKRIFSIIDGQIGPLNDLWNNISKQFQTGVINANDIRVNAGGLCCQQNFWGTCIWRNPARYEMYEQPNVYAAIRTASQSLVNLTYSTSLGYLTEVNKIFKNQNTTVRQKYQQYKIQEQSFQTYDLEKAKSYLNERIDRCNYYLSSICREPDWPPIAYRNTLYRMIDYINKLQNKTNNLKNKIDAFKSDFSFLDYQVLLDVIEVAKPIAWLNDTINIAIFQGRQSFRILFDEYQLSKYTIQQFLFSNNNIIQKYLNYFDQVKQKIDFFCLNKQQIDGYVNKSIKNLNEKLNVLKNSSSQQKIYFKGEINNFIPIFQANISQVFVDYQSILVCNNSNQVIHFLNTTSDILMKQFHTIQLVYQQFRRLYQSKTEQLANLFKLSNQIMSKFYTLRTKDEYVNFISKVYDYSKQVKNIYRFTINQTNYIRQKFAFHELKLNFTQYIVNEKTLVQYIYVFNNTLFIPHDSQVFTNASKLRKKANQTAYTLGYQIIQLLVTARQIKKQIEMILNFIPVSIPKYHQSIDSNFKALQDLKSNFTENQFQAIMNNLSLLPNLTNSIIFPYLTQQIPNILLKFSYWSVGINQNYRILYWKNYDIFKNITNMIKQWRKKLFQSIESKVKNSIRDIFNSLSITGLVKLNSLGFKIQTKFNQYRIILDNQLSELQKLQQTFKNDYQKLFITDKILSNVSSNIQKNYKNTIKQIGKYINTTLLNLDNQFLYNLKFKKLYRDLVYMQTSLQANFNSVNKIVNDIIILMGKQINQIPPDFKEKLLSLNKVKLILQNIKNSIDQRLFLINQAHENITITSSNIQQFFFNSLLQKIQQSFGFIQTISNSINMIMNEDLKNIVKLYQSNLPPTVTFIKKDLQQILSSYQLIDQYRYKALDSFSLDKITIRNYLNSKLVNQIYCLNTGQQYIKGKIVHYQNIQSYTIDEDYFDLNISTFQIYLPIVLINQHYDVLTELTFQGNIQYFLGIQNYRDFKSNMSANFTINIDASFQFFKYAKFNLFINGSIFDGKQQKSLTVTNLIPIQLTQHILSIQQMTDKNILRLNHKLQFIQDQYSFQRRLIVTIQYYKVHMFRKRWCFWLIVYWCFYSWIVDWIEIINKTQLIGNIINSQIAQIFPQIIQEIGYLNYF